ncbi:MAG TPA: hypothetical protein VME42_06210 [Steroidobacteraceae bacterium]|nr:hypothetical protein [Steroidobacteraceae bacterium]
MLHRAVERILLWRVHRHRPPLAQPVEPPAAIRSLIDALDPERHRFDERALHFGDRYRSGFWLIYLLSAVAVLFAVLPLAMGWDDSRHVLHPYLGVWALGEVLVISAVAAVYWIGHRRNWQGEWLRARTTAELIRYLPMLAPLVDFGSASDEADWYLRVFDPGQNLRGIREVTTLCRQHEGSMSEQLALAWSDPRFIAAYAAWSASVLERQEHYHRSVVVRQQALHHRIHSINIVLFGATGLGALTHLILHSLYLSIVTTFFPALGASLHGALAQSEAYRLEVASDRLARELKSAVAKIRAAAAGPEHAARHLGASVVAFAHDPALAAELVRNAVRSALALILEEHQDWHMLVRPHRLPLG